MYRDGGCTSFFSCLVYLFFLSVHFVSFFFAADKTHKAVDDGAFATHDEAGEFGEYVHEYEGDERDDE